MPPAATATRTAKPQRPPADPAVRTQRLYRRLHDQLAHDLFANALKTVSKLLLLDPSDPLALRTRAQLLVALDRFPEALHAEGTDTLAQAYCLYKLGRAGDAQDKLAEAEEEGEEDRAREVLQAQLHYRLGEYETARDAFDDLAATAEQDSPETADLQANLSACTSQLDFLSSVPSTLSSLNPPSIEELESRPLALVLPSSSARKPLTTTATTAAAAATTGGKKRRSRPLPARALDGSAPAPPAEDRWIPKRQRPSMRDALLQAKEKARGKKRDKVLLTQGAAEPVEQQQPKPSTPAKGGKSGGGGKKKKGKK
ncbi:hypothetical protein JCM6882_003069 [Rhodosporidiobolus microsporus]